jgi:hypothetical protein
MTVENQAPSVARGPHTADQMPRLLETLGISAQDVARVEPMVVQDMERVCALCESKRECDRDLASGASAGHYQEYCLNAPRIAQLHETWSWVSTTTPTKMALIGYLRALNGL